MRCACIHDLAGLGHCSLTAAIPVLSAMGVQACPVPTAVLSSQTDGYSGYSFLDMTPHLPAYIDHWKRRGERFDGIFTGFLGSRAQLALVEDFIRDFREPGSVVLVDPVMGDDGAVYDTYTADLCAGMARIASLATVITPNLTEAAQLLGESYEDAPRDEAGLLSWVRRLTHEVAPQAVITGVPSEAGDTLRIAVGDGSDACILTQPRLGGDRGSFPGTGDVFASVLAGALLHRTPLREAAQRAADFTGLCVARTSEAGTPREEGLLLEPMLAHLIP